MLLKWIGEKIDELESKYAEKAVDGKISGWVKLCLTAVIEGFCNGAFIVGCIAMFMTVVGKIKKLFRRG